MVQPFIFERFGSRAGRVATDPLGHTTTLMYTVVGTTDEAEVHKLVAKEIPDEFAGLLHQSWDVRQVGTDIWSVDVDYSNQDRRNIGDFTFSFEFGGGTEHITQSLETTGRYGMFGHDEPPDRGKAINVTLDGVGGCNIISPEGAFTATAFIDAGAMNSKRQREILRLVGTVNDDKFLDYERGELLLAGARGSKRSRRDWEVSFTFKFSPNQDLDITFGENQQFAPKLGWEYVWYDYEYVKIGNRSSQRPRGMYIERVYEFGDFKKLKIGAAY